MLIEHKVQATAAVSTAAAVLKRECGFSNKLLRELKYGGALRINGIPSRLKTTVLAGDVLTCDLPISVARINRHTELEILYETDSWLVVVKPAGMVTHPTTGHPDGTLTDCLSSDALHPVTRLDRHTSGLVLLAKCGHAHHQLSKVEYQKIYLGVVHGIVARACDLIDAPIGRSDFSYLTRIVHPLGKPARTSYRRLAINLEKQVSLLSFQLHTGRTHQIRVHQLWQGHPLVGDILYGRSFLDPAPGVQRPEPRFFRLDWPRNYSEYPVSRVQPELLERICLSSKELQPPSQVNKSSSELSPLSKVNTSSAEPEHRGQYLHCQRLIFRDPFTQKHIDICAEPPSYFQQYFSTDILTDTTAHDRKRIDK